MPEHQFVLVHGSWHDGSLWGPVAERLGELGHAVETSTTAGHAKNPRLLAEKLVEAGRD